MIPWIMWRPRPDQIMMLLIHVHGRCCPAPVMGPPHSIKHQFPSPFTINTVIIIIWQTKCMIWVCYSIEKDIMWKRVTQRNKALTDHIFPLSFLSVSWAIFECVIHESSDLCSPWELHSDYKNWKKTNVVPSNNVTDQ